MATVVGVDVQDRDPGVVVGIVTMVAVDEGHHPILPEDVRRDHVQDLENVEKRSNIRDPLMKLSHRTLESYIYKIEWGKTCS